MTNTTEIETLIIGGGQAGLATSYHLQQLGRPHLIVEQAPQAASAWRTDRWDSFTLVTPNWSLKMPGAEYTGPDPDGFLTRAELVDYFEKYIAHFQLPVRYGVRATAVEGRSDGRYQVRTSAGDYLAAQVVIAAGLFQRPKIPAFARALPTSVTQLHSGQYRHPHALPPGAVLVVGSAQSGCQIAEELYQSGRKVYLCVGSAGRAPRRYRGRDTYDWLTRCGFLDRTPDQLPAPRAKFAGNPHLSGKAGGRSLNLHQFARDGVTLLGRLQDARASILHFAPDLKDNLARADKVEADIVKMIDGYIQREGLSAPLETLPALRDGYAAEVISELDVDAAGIHTIIWAMGYDFDFSWVKLPVFDADGYPQQQRGVTASPGLYFMGLPWMHKQKSGLLLGVGEDAAHIASVIAARVG